MFGFHSRKQQKLQKLHGTLTNSEGTVQWQLWACEWIREGGGGRQGGHGEKGGEGGAI